MSATTPGLVGGRAAAGARRRRNSSPITTPNEAFPSPTTGACSRSCPGKLPVRISWRTILAKGENFRAAFRGFDQFVYMAAYGAKLAAKNALNSDSLCYDNGAIPAIVLTDPQVASVGLTEAAVRTAGYAVRVSTNGLDQVPRALAACDTRSLIKDRRRRRERSPTRRAYPRPGRRRRYSDRDARDPAGAYRRRSRGHDLCVPHDRRRPEARGAGICQGRRQAVLLRRLSSREGNVPTDSMLDLSVGQE